MSEIVITAVIAALGSGGIMAALVGWFKDRKKDNATAKLTDVEALQKQVVLLTSITDYLRKENDQLQADSEECNNRARIAQRQLVEVEKELNAVNKIARDAQMRCEELSARIRQMTGGEDV